MTIKPNTIGTGRVLPDSDLPVRMVTLNDARFITTTLEAYIALADRLHDVAATTPIDPDVRDRLERIILELDV